MDKLAIHEEFLNKKRFDLLDGIRGLAILAVIWHHSTGAMFSDHSIFSRGYLGVDLFFVLSGFLITHLLLREYAENGFISLKNFYIRRTLRIFPLFYGYIAFMFVWFMITSPEKFEQLLNVLHYYLLYLINWIPPEMEHSFERGWSLSVEEQFYLFWPAMLLFLGVRIPSLFILLIVVLTVVLSEGVLGEKGIYYSSFAVPFRTILMGCFVAILLNTSSGFLLFNKWFNNRYSMLAVALLMVIIVAIEPESIYGYHQFIVHLLMAAFIAASVINENNWLKPLLTLAPLKLMGLVSYGIYVLHGQFWGVAQKIVSFIPIEVVANSKISFFIVFTIISTIVALVSFYTYEKFFLDMKHKFYTKKPETN
ncbi:MAG: acyltransferase family protein [Cellvibrionaceae bacterium]